MGARSASTNLWELAARAQKFSKVPSFSTPNINLQVKNTLYFILFLLPRPPKNRQKLPNVAQILGENRLGEMGDNRLGEMGDNRFAEMWGRGVAGCAQDVKSCC